MKQFIPRFWQIYMFLALDYEKVLLQRRLSLCMNVRLASTWTVVRISFISSIQEFIHPKSVAIHILEIFLRPFNERGHPLRWPRNALYPQKLALLRQQSAVARSA
jgi:hypothetical protein